MNNIPADMVDVSPFPCDFKKGDNVIYTNDYGIEFELTVKGFAKENHSNHEMRFVYIFDDAWWFPVNPAKMRLIKERK